MMGSLEARLVRRGQAPYGHEALGSFGPVVGSPESHCRP